MRAAHLGEGAPLPRNIDLHCGCQAQDIEKSKNAPIPMKGAITDATTANIMLRVIDDLDHDLTISIKNTCSNELQQITKLSIDVNKGKEA